MYILSDLKAAQITPNADTYAHIMLTYLVVPGPEYDQAFLYLEEMKKAGYIPKSGIYATFVKKCVFHNDDRAWTVLEEMEKCGYRTQELKDYIRNAQSINQRSRMGRERQDRMWAFSRRKEVEGTEMFRPINRNTNHEAENELADMDGGKEDDMDRQLEVSDGVNGQRHRERL